MITAKFELKPPPYDLVRFELNPPPCIVTDYQMLFGILVRLLVEKCKQANINDFCQLYGIFIWELHQYPLLVWGTPCQTMYKLLVFAAFLAWCLQRQPSFPNLAGFQCNCSHGIFLLKFDQSTCTDINFLPSSNYPAMLCMITCKHFIVTFSCCRSFVNCFVRFSKLRWACDAFKLHLLNTQCCEPVKLWPTEVVFIFPKQAQLCLLWSMSQAVGQKFISQPHA